MKLTPFQVIDTVILTEKSQIAQETQGKYTFRVHPQANKIEIRNAIESIYPDVKVKSVNVLNYTGKARRSGRSPKSGMRPDWKKAVVTLKSGSIEFV